MKNNISSNRNYTTENINLRQQIIDLKVANKDKAETIKSMKQELIEYSKLRDRFKVLYEENKKYKQLQEELGCPLDVMFKALKEGLIIKAYDDELDVTIINTFEPNELVLDFIAKSIITGEGYIDYVFPLENYGKTWWLPNDRRIK